MIIHHLRYEFVLTEEVLFGNFLMQMFFMTCSKSTALIHRLRGITFSFSYEINLVLHTFRSAETGIFGYQAYIKLYLSRNQDILLGATAHVYFLYCLTKLSDSTAKPLNCMWFQ